MKDIELLIRKNKGTFNGFEPSDGHFERFTAKLEAHAYVAPKRVNITPYLLKAAAVAILFTISSLWTWEHVVSPDAKRTTLGEVSPEYAQVEKYYVQQVSMIENEIKTIDIVSNEDQNKILMDEFKEMDKMYEELQKDLKANPNDERVINAMIEHYERKVEVMSYILTQLKDVTSENQINSENYETVRL